MSDPKCAGMMLESASRDVRTLHVLADEGPEESFGFHVQQAAEKAFKAWIATLGGLYELTHDLDELLNQLQSCGAADSDVERFRALAGYTPYAVEFRYRGADPWVEPIDRDGAIALVVELLDRARAELATVEARGPQNG